MKSISALVAGLATGVLAQPNVNTATGTSAVYAARATAATDQSTPSYVSGAVFDRYIQIWLENTDYSKAAGDPNLAWLASQGITLTNYFGVTHPSEPNYVASIGGDNFGMDNDNFNQIDANVSTVIDLLEDAQISWSTYEEDMPYTGFEGVAWTNPRTKANDYVRKHNPPVIYNANTTPRRLSFQKNLTEFSADLNAQRLPQWIFITPNMTSDGHDTSVTTAGQWTRNFLQPLLSNPYLTARTLILVTFDETHTYTTQNRVFSLLLGGAVPSSLQNTVDNTYYNHYSNLATVEANWNLHTLGRWDVGANVFSFVAATTGDKPRSWPDATSASAPKAFFNSSFAGPFNTGFRSAGYPIPNVDSVSPGTGRTVLPGIVATWGDASRSGSAAMYYNNGVQIPDGLRPPPGYQVNNAQN